MKLAEPDDEASNIDANSINSVDDNIIKEDDNIINTSMKEEPKIEKQPKKDVNVSSTLRRHGSARRRKPILSKFRSMRTERASQSPS